MKQRQLPTLRAVGLDDEPEGFPIVEVHVDDRWTIETVGMRASDIGDTMTSESLATLLAAAPDLLAACEALLEEARQFFPTVSGEAITLGEAAIKKARGTP